MPNKNFGRSQLIDAVIENDMGAIRVYTNEGADLNVHDCSGWTALHFAARNQNVEAIDYLVHHGALVDSTDENGNTPLFHAVFNYRGVGEAIGLLISLGADVNKANLYGVSPKTLAFKIANYSPKRFFSV